MYAVELHRDAAGFLKRLDRKLRERLLDVLSGLAVNPVPPDSRAMQGRWKGHYRVRVGDYRALYRVEEGRMVVLVVRIAPRGDVYGR